MGRSICLGLTLLLFLTLSRPGIALAPLAITTEYAVVGGNSFIGYSAPSVSEYWRFPQPQVLASLVADSDVFRGLKYESLIRCLADKESTTGLNRSGDNGESTGLLHYWRWWESDSLWGSKCVAEYGYTDIDNDRQQVECADRLLRKNFDKYIKRWTSSKKCL